MKKSNLLGAIISLLSISLSAQTPSGYVSYHQHLKDAYGQIQTANGNSRAIAYKQIGYLHLVNQGVGSGWIYSDSAQFNYTQQAWATGGVYYKFVSPGWVTTSQFANVNDGNGVVQTTTGQVADSTAWINSYLYTYTYYTTTPVGYMATKTLQTWNGSNWVDSLKYTYSYNSDSYNDTITMQKASGGILQNDSQFIYNYTGYDNTQLLTRAWNGSTWVNALNQYNSFDANHNNVQSFAYTWNGSSWTNYSQVIKGYDGYSDMVSYILQLWNPLANGGLGGYVNSYSESKEYVLRNNTQFANYTWSDSTHSWMPLVINTYSYDINNNNLFEYDYTYNGSGFDTTDIYYYDYTPFTVSDIMNYAGVLNTNLFPNPVTGNTVALSFSNNQAGMASVCIYDETGKMVKLQSMIAFAAGSNLIRLDLTGLASGYYWVSVTNSEGAKSINAFIKQ